MKMHDFKINRANIKHCHEIISLLKIFHSESYGKISEFAHNKAFLALENIIQNQDCSTFIAQKNKKIIGIISGHIQEMWFSNTKIGQEAFWFVLPEYRGRIGIELFNKLEYDLIEKGANIINMAHLNHGMDLSRFYEKNGYKLSELSYFKVV